MLMVGDDLDNDVLAPRRAGIASVWLNWKRAPTPARSAAHGPPRMALLVHFAWYAQPWFRPHPLVPRELRAPADPEQHPEIPALAKSAAWSAGGRSSR